MPEASKRTTEVVPTQLNVRPSSCDVDFVADDDVLQEGEMRRDAPNRRRRRVARVGRPLDMTRAEGGAWPQLP